MGKTNAYFARLPTIFAAGSFFSTYGLDKELITPRKSILDPNSDVKKRERLGGLLNYYCREAV